MWHRDGLKTDLEGRVEKDGWLSKPSALSNVGVRSNHGLRTPSEDINQRNLKIWADVADNIWFGRT